MGACVSHAESEAIPSGRQYACFLLAAASCQAGWAAATPTLLTLCSLPSSSSSSSSSSFPPPPPPPSPPPSRDNKYNHCRIHTKSEGGRTKYYLIDQTCFDSIFDLIEYYKVRREDYSHMIVR